MGIFKKFFGAAEREAKNVAFQQRAVLKADKISKGEKVPPPKYPTEEKHFKEAAADTKLRELVNKKDEPLIDKVNKIKITRIDPPERPRSDRALPTRDTEAHRSFDVWEHGFYEPRLEKMEKNKLMLREAMEILRARMELDPPDYDQPPRENQDDALALLESHPACKRVDQEKLDLVWKYFRPFARSDKQVVVDKHTLLELRRIMQARDDEAQMLTNQYEWRKYFEEKLADARRQRLREYYHGLEEEEKTKFLEKVKQQRQIEHKRLQDQMEELFKLEEEKKTKTEDPSAEETKKRIEGSGRSS